MNGTEKTPESPTRWRKTKIAFAIAIGCGCLYFLLSLIYEAGDVHYQIHKNDLHSIAAEANELDMVPGLIMEIEPKLSLLESEAAGPVRVHCDRGTARRFVMIDLDGAFGRHGYVYAQDPAVTNVNAEGFPNYETRQYHQVDDQWWSYYSTKP